MIRGIGLLVLLSLAAAAPAFGEATGDATGVTVLRGTSAPPPAVPPPPVIVQTVVYPEIVYVPSYTPAFAFYPGYFVAPRRFLHQQSSPAGFPRGHK